MVVNCTVKDGFGLPGSMGGGAQGGGAGSYKPPFKNVEVVYINIKASLFEVKKRCHKIVSSCSFCTVIQYSSQVMKCRALNILLLILTSNIMVM